MIKKSLVLVAVSLSVCAALYSHDPPVLSSWIPANSIEQDARIFCGNRTPQRQYPGGWRLRRDRVPAQLRRQRDIQSSHRVINAHGTHEAIPCMVVQGNGS